jgi:peptidoglycan glycosyltransferase
MNGPIRQLATALFVGLAVLVAAVTWIQVVQANEFRDDPRNTRVITARVGRERGTIITADGVVAAMSAPNQDDPQVFTRQYPEGDLYAHVVGYSTALFGDTGIEASRAAELTSDRDSTISGVINALLGGDLRPQGLRLTVDHALQTTAYEALAGQIGAVVAIDPTTGAVLAMASNPTFDPNLLTGFNAGPQGAALENYPDRPLLNRAAQETYNPGSTFKTVTAAAALESGVAGPATPFPNEFRVEHTGSTATISNAGGRRCGDGATVTLTTAFVLSCNTVFAVLGIEVGPEALVGQAEALGFNTEPATTDFRAVASAIPEAASFENADAALAQTAIGERDVRATPLQMAIIAATVANGGQLMEPYLVAEVFNADAEVEETSAPTPLGRAFSPATAEALSEMMEGVVTSGTGQRATVSGVRIGGKTGTAETPGDAPHAWFIGYGPVDAAPGEPQIAIAVLIESGGAVGATATGGTLAAPIARAVLAEFFSNGS